MAQSIFTKIFPAKLQLWGKPQSVVGVDIGTSSIKVVQLRKEKEQAVLETYGDLAAGPYAGQLSGQTPPLASEKIVEMLKDLFREAGVNAAKSAVAISLKSSFVTIIKLPLVAKEEMGSMIQFEARKYIPVPLSEVQMDWWILPSVSNKDGAVGAVEKGGKPATEVMLVAIHKEVLEKYRDIISKLGLEAPIFELEIFSSARSSLYRQAVPVMIIDLGASSTKMSVVDYGVIRATYLVNHGSQSLTATIAKALNIGFERAESMKLEIGLSQKPEHKELVSVMEPQLNLIFSEAKQLMSSFRKKYNTSIGRIVLTGGGSLLKGITDFAVKSFGTETVLADPFSRTEYPPFFEEALKENGPIYGSAVGLAFRAL
jgi:type IV pilus assembly protein PilM